METTKEAAQVLFAHWLQQTYPDVFAELAKRAGVPEQGVELAGWAEFIGAVGNIAGKVGTVLTSSVKAVGSFLGSQTGQNVLSAVVATKVAGAVNQSAIATQAQRADTGMPPAAIQTYYDPATNTYVPLVQTVTGAAQPLNQQILASLRPSFFDQYGPWLLGGGALLGLLVFALRR